MKQTSHQQCIITHLFLAVSHRTTQMPRIPWAYKQETSASEIFQSRLRQVQNRKAECYHKKINGVIDTCMCDFFKTIMLYLFRKLQLKCDSGHILVFWKQQSVSLQLLWVHAICFENCERSFCVYQHYNQSKTLFWALTFQARGICRWLGHVACPKQSLLTCKKGKLY